jgi:hypothetical protein
MFEGNIVRTGREPASAEGTSGEEMLRALSWEEIIARLGAARDFRSLMERQRDAGGGSFNASSARLLAALGEGQPGINPFALTNRKMTKCNDFGVTSDAATDDRGRQ